MNKILMYHSVGKVVSGEAGAELYCVSLENFAEQMEYIKNGDGPILTFDDGDITNYKYAYPILKSLGMKAIFFIIVYKVGSKGYMNWKQIKELRDEGMVIGSHGLAHRILTEASDIELDYELRRSKMVIEEKLGEETDYFSIPRGFCDKKIIKKARELGYKKVFTSDPEDADGFKFGRIAVKSDWSFEYFKRIIDNGLPLKEKAGNVILGSAKKILGAKGYSKARERILKMGRK